MKKLRAQLTNADGVRDNNRGGSADHASLSLEQVASRANALTASFTAPAIPVLDIAEGNGVNVIFTDFGTHKDTVSGFCDFDGARLYVNPEDRMTRQAFTIAHELGHWLLHKEVYKSDPQRYPVLPRHHSPDLRNPLEFEANMFAGHLLVPERLLKSVRGAPVSFLADIFGVSISMMETRLEYE